MSRQPQTAGAALQEIGVRNAAYDRFVRRDEIGTVASVQIGKLHSFGEAETGQERLDGALSTRAIVLHAPATFTSAGQIRAQVRRVRPSPVPHVGVRRG